MSPGQSMRHHVGWLFAGNSVTQVLGFLFGMMLARLLRPVSCLSDGLLHTADYPRVQRCKQGI